MKSVDSLPDQFVPFHDTFRAEVRDGSLNISGNDVSRFLQVRAIQTHYENWGHYHTGGYPGRNEIDETQTLDYAELMMAIVNSGFKGHVGQEFVPKRENAMESLQQAVSLCDV